MGRPAETGAAEAAEAPPAARRALRRQLAVFWTALTVAVLATGNLWRAVEALAGGTASAFAWLRIAALSPVVALSVLISGRVLVRHGARRAADSGIGAGPVVTPPGG